MGGLLRLQPDQVLQRARPRAAAERLNQSPKCRTKAGLLSMTQPFLTVILVAAFAAVLSSCSSQSNGPEICRGCRLEAEVIEVGGRREVQSYSLTECSTWVVQSGVMHEHSWTRTGCWQSRSGFSTLAPPDIGGADWFAYVQDLSGGELAILMGRDLLDPVVWQEVKGAVDVWRANSSAPLDGVTPRR